MPLNDTPRAAPLDHVSRASSAIGPALLVGGGIAALAMAWAAARRVRSTEATVQTAIASGGAVNLRLTTYWPKSATEAERKMEGGVQGAAVWRGKKAIDPTTGKRPVLYTLEEHLAGKAPYVSLSGDPEAWPFGQRVVIDAFPGAVFRVVDTGGRFSGMNKLYRLDGYEPLDVCVDSKNSKVPSTATGRIVKGDSFDGGEVAAAKFKGQTVVVGCTEANHAIDAVSLL